MLIKELSKTTRIFAKDLLKSPVGVMCYIVDCLKLGYDITDILIKLNGYPLSALSIQEVLQNKELLAKLKSIHMDIKCLVDVFKIEYEEE